MPRLAGLPRLRSLSLQSSSLTDRHLQHLRGCVALASLDLSATSIEGSGLAELHGLPQLKELAVSDQPCSPELLPEAIAIPTVTSLWLIRLEAFSTESLAALAGASQLRDLKFMNVPVDDRAVEHLLQAKGLRSLYLLDTSISPEGVQRLKQGLPNCRVVCSGN